MHTCPWWFTWTFDNPLRRLVHDPRALLAPYVHEGMRVADIGCGMGHFTVALADLVGPAGQVQAVDLQPQQLRVAARRCRRAGTLDRVQFVEAAPDSLNLTGPLDFVLAFYVVHEVADQSGLFRQLHAASRPGAKILVSEPRIHVPRATVEAERALATAQGFTGVMRDGAARFSWTFELQRTAPGS
jgi:ubiquinone/menaquinone biosynthesis C-methylase UbiE